MWLVTRLLLLAALAWSLPDGAGEDQSVTVDAREMRFSENVTAQADYVVIWGLGRQRYAWVGYDVTALPFRHFVVEAEVRADTAANRWPELGLALNDSSRVVSRRTVTSTDWQVVTFDPVQLSDDDAFLYLAFLNDYRNRKRNQDLNVHVRKVTFRSLDEVEVRSVKVTWDRNPESFVGGYKLYYGTESRNYSRSLDVGNVTEVEVTLEVGPTYYFAVTAYHAQTRRESPYSEEVVFRFEEPATVVDCDLDGNGEVNVRDWFAFRRSLNSQRGDRNYSEKADFNGDGRVDAADEEIARSACFEKKS